MRTGIKEFDFAQTQTLDLTCEDRFKQLSCSSLCSQDLTIYDVIELIFNGENRLAWFTK